MPHASERTKLQRTLFDVKRFAGLGGAVGVLSDGYRGSDLYTTHSIEQTEQHGIRLPLRQ